MPLSSISSSTCLRSQFPLFIYSFPPLLFFYCIKSPLFPSILHFFFSSNSSFFSHQLLPSSLNFLPFFPIYPRYPFPLLISSSPFPPHLFFPLNFSPHFLHLHLSLPTPSHSSVTLKSSLLPCPLSQFLKFLILLSTNHLVSLQFPSILRHFPYLFPISLHLHLSIPYHSSFTLKSSFLLLCTPPCFVKFHRLSVPTPSSAPIPFFLPRSSSPFYLPSLAAPKPCPSRERQEAALLADVTVASSVQG